jgi:hypothetical protein
VKGPEMRMPAGGGRRACNTCDELSVVWGLYPRRGRRESEASPPFPFGRRFARQRGFVFMPLSTSRPGCERAAKQSAGWRAL